MKAVQRINVTFLSVLPLFAQQKPKAFSEEPGHPLCAARVENEKLFERKRVLFRLARKHVAGRLCAGALTFFDSFFVSRQKRNSGFGADSPEREEKDGRVQGRQPRIFPIRTDKRKK